MHAYVHVYVSGLGGGGASICAVGYVTGREMHGVEALYCMCDRERWFSDSNHFAISLSRLFIGVSAFCVLLYELTTKQTDLLSQHSAIQGVKGCMCVCACVCVCLGVCVYYSYIHMRVTPGMCGRRAAR